MARRVIQAGYSWSSSNLDHSLKSSIAGPQHQARHSPRVAANTSARPSFLMIFRHVDAAEPFLGLGQRLVDGTSRRAAASALVGPQPCSHADLAHAVEATAAALHRDGVTKGHRFAVLSRNGATMIQLLFAASLCGAVVVPLNHRLSARELAVIMADASPDLLFVEHELVSLLADVAEPPTTVLIDSANHSDEYLHWRGAPTTPPTHVAHPDDVVIQMYTTGTTGAPKGALLTERNLAVMVDSLPTSFMVDEQSRYLGLLPMFHISGAGTALGVLVAGGSIVLASGTSAGAVLRDLVDHRVTHVNLVPSLMSMLLAEPRMASADLAALEVVMYGAAPTSGTVVEEMMARVPQTTFVHGYGLTECAGGVAFMPPIRHGATVSHRPGLVGRPSAGCEIRIVDPDTFTDVTPGQAGEIWVRSERTIPGYWNRPDESAALYGEPGWLRTGDIGLFEGDDLILKDRLKDMIISGGENVYSAEVEHVAALHPAVAEAAAVGVPDTRWGEVVALVVTLRPGDSLEPGDLIEFCRQRLAHYKCPKSVHVVDDLPRTGNGKIMKRAIRDHLSAAL